MLGRLEVKSKDWKLRAIDRKKVITISKTISN